MEVAVSYEQGAPVDVAQSVSMIGPSMSARDLGNRFGVCVLRNLPPDSIKCRGTSLMRNRAPIGPCSRTMPTGVPRT